MATSLNIDAHAVTVPVEDYVRLRTALARYEFMRTLTPQKFSELWEMCMKEDINFDKQIDAEIAYLRHEDEKRRIAERKAMLKGPFKQAWESW